MQHPVNFEVTVIPTFVSASSVVPLQLTTVEAPPNNIEKKKHHGYHGSMLSTYLQAVVVTTPANSLGFTGSRLTSSTGAHNDVWDFRAAASAGRRAVGSHGSCRSQSEGPRELQAWHVSCLACRCNSTTCQRNGSKSLSFKDLKGSKRPVAARTDTERGSLEVLISSRTA